MIRKFLHITLALYLTMLSGGVVLNKHYCGEMLESISVYLDAPSCCDNADPMQDCCHNESTVFALDKNFFNQSSLVIAQAPVFQIIIPEFTFLNELFHNTISVKSIIFPDYSPPPLIADIQVAVQSFLL